MSTAPATDSRHRRNRRRCWCDRRCRRSATFPYSPEETDSSLVLILAGGWFEGVIALVTLAVVVNQGFCERIVTVKSAGFVPSTGANVQVAAPEVLGSPSRSMVSVPSTFQSGMTAVRTVMSAQESAAARSGKARDGQQERHSRMSGHTNAPSLASIVCRDSGSRTKRSAGPSKPRTAKNSVTRRRPSTRAM